MAYESNDYSAMSHIPPNSQYRPANGMGPPKQHRNGYKHQKENGMPVPGAGAGGYYRNDPEQNTMPPAPQLFDVARSPPSGPNKNTKHVPCKFFRQGTCQAGNACPFSHNLDPTTHQAPCKYFMKGNCKFGAKCALAHYLPDGRRVNQRDLESGINQMANMPFGRSRSQAYPPADFGPHDRVHGQPTYPPDYFRSAFGEFEEPDAFHDRYNQYQPNPNFDPAINSPPTHFGSPPNDPQFPKSPVEGLRTALNAPLPQSFDASGMSRIAQYGPLGQSVPDKFGTASPGASSLSRQLASPPDAGGFRGSTPGSNLRNASPLAASPQNADESIGQRIMHSQKQQTKPRMISASVPRSSLHPDWEEGFDGEADLLPNSLHDEVLTPAEKMRRMSRPDQYAGSAMAIPSGTSSNVGSPPVAGSPSRFSALWAEQREKKAAETATSGLGQVGSPLRESWMPSESSVASRAPQVSGISQGMAQLHLTRSEDSNSGRPQLGGFRHSSNPVGRFDRTVASPGLNAKRIDEEGEGVFFPMDDDRRWAGASPRLAPLREKPNGEISRSKREEPGLGPSAGANSFYGFRS